VVDASVMPTLVRVAATAFRVAVALDAEDATGTAVAVGVAGLAAATAAGTDAGALVAIAHALANLVLVAIAEAAATRAAGLALLSADHEHCGCRADPRHTRLTGRAGLTADPTVDRAGHEVGAVVAAVGRAGGTLGSDAFAVLAEREDAGVPRDRATDVVASAAVFIVAAEVPAQVDRAAIRDSYGAISPLADPASAFDADETALADRAACTAVVHVRLEIDADPVAVGLTRFAR
jgi:hypothetical protein